jgi:predicted protein tyrosine phosphatase
MLMCFKSSQNNHSFIFNCKDLPCKSLMNILFVCSKNKWRSRTAETIFKNSANHLVKSAGTSQNARVKLNENHLVWADLVFVMEEKHLQIIEQKFHSKSFSDKIIVLDIPDDYKYMDEELILTLKASVSNFVEDLV